MALLAQDGGKSAQLGGCVSPIGRQGGGNTYKVFDATAYTWPSGSMAGECSPPLTHGTLASGVSCGRRG